MALKSATVIGCDDENIKPMKFKSKVVWSNAVIYLMLHLSALYGLYLALTKALLKTTLFGYIFANFALIGITAGSHRLWSHRSYKAKWPLRVLLCIFASIAGQNDIYEWCRDHRVHHKFSETDADPHNIKRGFFFAHVGWLMCKKHPAVAAEGKSVHLDDLWEDPVVRFHRKFYKPMLITFCFYLPIMMPVWLWRESLWNSFFVAGLLRYCFTLNAIWLVNSVAHYHGDRPVDKNIEARESPFVSLASTGEGWHNYHHVFPWDYAASELGYTLNLAKLFIDLMAFVGLAYDLKTVNSELLKNRKLKTGDGTRLKNSKVH